MYLLLFKVQYLQSNTHSNTVHNRVLACSNSEAFLKLFETQTFKVVLLKMILNQVKDVVKVQYLWDVAI